MRRLSLRGQIPGFWKVVLMGDGIQRYAACDECSCLDMRDGGGAYVLHADHEAALAAAVEERDREIERLKQGLWDCAGEAGTDLDGDPTPRHLAYPDIVDFALRAVRELRRDYEEEDLSPDGKDVSGLPGGGSVQ